MAFQLYDTTSCELGEGPLWHPLRRELFWFDIKGRKLLCRNGPDLKTWQFDHTVSAAGWIDVDNILIAAQTSLIRFDISTGQHETVMERGPEDLPLRFNDGRADPWGGFWVGTTEFRLARNAGAIYRYYHGELRKLYEPITVPNAICFSPDRRFAYFTDTPTSIVWRQELSELHGWPLGEPDKWLDLSDRGFYPDGAICDVEGNFWNAQWDAARLVRYSAMGEEQIIIDLPTDRITCPELGGEDYCDLYATSALVGLDRSTQPHAGQTFRMRADIPGQREHQVIL